MVRGMREEQLKPPSAADAPLTVPTMPGDVPTLVAALYEEAPTPLRERLLNHLLRPLGPLALVAVAAGAFARWLPSGRWSDVHARFDDVFFSIGGDQVFDLAAYVEQKAPELLSGLPDLLSATPMWTSTLSAALLLMALREALRSLERTAR
jgi:hypothetical protein